MPVPGATLPRNFGFCSLSLWSAVAALSLHCDTVSAKELILASLADLSLEELSNTEITSVSKRPERLSDAAASVFVITADEIRRSGAISLPEALRLAPNLQVARDSASEYVITARGFGLTGNTTANKMLVLIDGRSVYTPLFAGVSWDVQDVMLEDIERIEVISGPGSTLWGTNAVNGVINIVTRTAGDTQGALISAGAGSRDKQAAVRYGGQLGDYGHYRVYAKHADAKNTEAADGSPRDDDWRRNQAGFRVDWARFGNEFTVQGNVYDGAISQAAPGALKINGIVFDIDTMPVSGVNLLARWARQLEGGANLSVQAYYDRTKRDIPPFFNETLDIFDLQFQHSFKPAASHTFSWGGEYRYGIDRVENTNALIGFVPDKDDQRWISLFAQDEITLSENLRLTLGARLERNDYTGNEFLPSARLAWKFAPDHLLWAAASRAVRAPSRLDRDIFVPIEPPFLLNGGGEVQSEVAEVYEIGYRGQPAKNFSYSLTSFLTIYDHLRTQEIDFSGPFLFFGSEMEGETFGVEMWGAYQVSKAWRLSGGLTHLKKNLRLKSSSTDVTTITAEEEHDPETTWILRSSWDLPHQMEFDATVRYVSAVSSPHLESYFAVDLRYAWRPRPNIELSVVGQNLFDGRHAEYSDDADPRFRSEYGPSVFFKFVGRY